MLHACAGAVVPPGIAHILPTRNVVRGFGMLSAGNTRIITREWISIGLALCFIGFLVPVSVAHAGPGSLTVRIVGRAGRRIGTGASRRGPGPAPAGSV